VGSAVSVLDVAQTSSFQLEKQDFKVRTKTLSKDIRYFSRQSDLPLRIGMLRDTSNSIAIDQVRADDGPNKFYSACCAAAKMKRS